MSAINERGSREGSRFTQTIRGVQAGVAYLIRTPLGRPARDVWDVDVVGHDSLMPPRLYAVDRARGAIVFQADHAIVTVIARVARQPLSEIGRRAS